MKAWCQDDFDSIFPASELTAAAVILQVRVFACLTLQRLTDLLVLGVPHTTLGMGTHHCRAYFLPSAHSRPRLRYVTHCSTDIFDTAYYRRLMLDYRHTLTFGHG